VDSIVLLGNTDAQLKNFLTKMGYNVQTEKDSVDINQLIQKNPPDLLVIDSRQDLDSVQLLHFLRDQEVTKQVPIVYLAKDKHNEQRINRLDFKKVEVVPIPYRVGTVVSKIATQVRIRKFNGADEATATLGEINSRLRELNEKFTKQLQEAREIQLSLVTEKLPKDERLGMAVAYLPLEEVGGDWYYVQQHEDGKVRVHIADVTGHGLSAAFIGSMTKLAMNAAGNFPPAEQLAVMNKLMSANIPAGKYVTMLTYLYEPENGKVVVARGGHPPALILNRATGEVTRVKTDGFAVGFFEEAEYASEEFELGIGDVIFTFTDALPESQNLKNETYNYDRMADVLKNSDPSLSASKLLQLILEDFDNFRDGRILKDDVTAIVLKREK
jgi:sigma-B regulation protein RsbU (phosphoserine phosphatase)